MALREGGTHCHKTADAPDQGVSRIGKPIRRSVRGDHIPNTTLIRIVQKSFFINISPNRFANVQKRTQLSELYQKVEALVLIQK
jgi:hypothetical protein